MLCTWSVATVIETDPPTQGQYGKRHLDVVRRREKEAVEPLLKWATLQGRQRTREGTIVGNHGRERIAGKRAAGYLCKCVSYCPSSLLGVGLWTDDDRWGRWRSRIEPFDSTHHPRFEIAPIAVGPGCCWRAEAALVLHMPWCARQTRGLSRRGSAHTDIGAHRHVARCNFWVSSN